MPKRDYIDFQSRTQPLAYLITFRCYGTWLHGEERGSIDRRYYHRYGTPEMPPNKKVLADERRDLKTPARHSSSLAMQNHGHLTAARVTCGQIRS